MQSGFDGSGARWNFSRGFVSPLERNFSEIATAARAPRRCSSAGGPFPEALLRRKFQAGDALHKSRAEINDGLRMAGQRPRTGKCNRAFGGARNWNSARRRFAARNFAQQRYSARYARASIGIFHAVERRIGRKSRSRQSPVAISNGRRIYAPNSVGYARAHRMESDGSRRASTDSALHAESKN